MTGKMKVSDDILYVGVNDHEVDLFEGQYEVPNGMAYNSYVILDEKTAVMDTVDVHFGQQWLANVEEALQGRIPDYLIVQHMEPDHSANIPLFLEKYPQAYELNSHFDAFKNGGIYACDTQLTSFFTDFPFHPDMLLEEYISIFHPSLLPGYNRRYFYRIEQ